MASHRAYQPPMAALAIGVRDVAFHKKCSLKIEDMAKSKWVHLQLRNFRAGIEAGISCLKPASNRHSQVRAPRLLHRPPPGDLTCLLVGQKRRSRHNHASDTKAATCSTRNTLSIAIAAASEVKPDDKKQPVYGQTLN